MITGEALGTYLSIKIATQIRFIYVMVPSTYKDKSFNANSKQIPTINYTWVLTT